MVARQYVAYYRVSSRAQGQSGLGLEAQREAVRRYVQATSGKLFGEFFEVKSGRTGNRPQLAEALRICRMRRAVLLIARLDRLARNVALVSSLMDSDLEFVAADFPQATRLTLHLLAAFAEYESKIISERIKAALAAAKARGVKLGSSRPWRPTQEAMAASRATRRAKMTARAMDLAPIVWDLRAQGRTQAEIAEELGRQKIETPQKAQWCASGVLRILRLTASQFPSFEQASKAHPRPQSRRAQRQAEALAPLAWELTRHGMSLTSIAEDLNRRGVATPRNAEWRNATVLNILRRTAATHGSIAEAKDVASPSRRSLHADQRAFDLAPLLWKLRGRGKSLAAMASELDRRRFRAPRGAKWQASTVRRILMRTAPVYAPADDLVTAVRVSRHPDEKKRRAMEYAPIVWQLRAEGKALEAIAAELDLRKIASPRGRSWSVASISAILKLTASEFASPGEPAAGRSNLYRVRAGKHAKEFGPVVWALRERGMSLGEIAAEMTRLKAPTSKGRPRWAAKTVSHVLRLTQARKRLRPSRIMPSKMTMSSRWPLMRTSSTRPSNAAPSRRGKRLASG
jgi:DNA invertase Pin-like site-specific DNA recombinase